MRLSTFPPITIDEARQGRPNRNRNQQRSQGLALLPARWCRRCPVRRYGDGMGLSMSQRNAVTKQVATRYRRAGRAAK